jgi:hypothetical protein
MERLKKYLPIFFYSCKKVSEIISKDDLNSTTKEQIILWYHSTLCRTCRHYKTQSYILENTLSESLKVCKNNFLSEAKKKEIVLNLKR